MTPINLQLLHNVLLGSFLNGSLITHAVSGAKCRPPLFRCLLADVFSHMSSLLRCFMPGSCYQLRPANCLIPNNKNQCRPFFVEIISPFRTCSQSSILLIGGFSMLLYQKGAEGAFLHGSAKRCPPRKRREAPPARPPVRRCAPASQLIYGTT